MRPVFDPELPTDISPATFPHIIASGFIEGCGDRLTVNVADVTLRKPLLFDSERYAALR